MYNVDKMVTLIQQYKFAEASEHIRHRCKDPVKLATRTARLVGRMMSEDNSVQTQAATELFLINMEKGVK